MNDPIVAGLVAVAGVLVLEFVLLKAMGGDRLGLAWRVLREPALADRIKPLLEAKKEKASGVPLRALALLQREGRLLDFLLEDITSYADPQVGAAVRDIHRQCQAALKEHLVLEPIFKEAEEASVEVPAGFDPSAIRLTGNVAGNPPFRGTLRHHGWRVAQIKIAPPPEGQDEMVLAPAEVEL